MKAFNLIVTTTFGIEAITKKEIEKLGYQNLVVENGKIELAGDVRDIAMLNTWLRTAERVLIKMAAFKATSFEALFNQTVAIDWAALMPIDAKMHVVGKSVKSQLYSVPDCQSIVKKAIIKAMSKSYGVDHFEEDGPVYKIEVALLKDVVTLSIDTSGAGLHKRGYRAYAGAAPLKETLAAALVMMSRWKFSQPMIDPFCGSGTILIEAAMFARNIAPGLKRSFVCEAWPSFNAQTFSQVREEAQHKMFQDNTYKLIGYDIDDQVLRQARSNAKAAGVSDDIEFHQRDFSEFSSPISAACLVTNPPYGERLSDEAEVRKLNEMMGDLRDDYPHWGINVFTAFGGFERDFGETASKNRKLYNGRILTRFYNYYPM
ncbi:MAG: class I SAM-dependent RNA methyltransferase [Defluviitaleaceae bacterium]|nr:class I SAM-dependent RNA methyltransferase [Defluviitaleaceae bacterium]